MAIRSRKTKVVVRHVLQGNVESYEVYDQRLQKIIDDINNDPATTIKTMLLPTASSSGRICMTVQWHEYKHKPKKAGAGAKTKK